MKFRFFFFFCIASLPLFLAPALVGSLVLLLAVTSIVLFIVARRNSRADSRPKAFEKSDETVTRHYNWNANISVPLALAARRRRGYKNHERRFWLARLEGSPLPQAVACLKKPQVGMLLSPKQNQVLQ